MIGSGLKKLAVANGLKVAKGVAYGSFRGYAVTMSEGAGFKQILFSAKFPDDVSRARFTTAVEQVDTQKEYRVQNIGITSRTIQIVFLDNPGTMKRIEAFLEWFIPLLHSSGVSTSDICPECGGQVIGGRWVMVDGCAHHLHDSCAAHVRQEIAQEAEDQKQQATGSYGLGALGAFLGAALGAVVWALVLMMGYVASIVGLLIGWLADRGYGLLHGKQGKAKIAILILAIIFGVLIGTYGGYVLSVMQAMNEYPIPGLTYADIPELISIMMEQDPQMRSGVISDVCLGLLFAALGVFAMLKKTSADLSGVKIVDLE